MHYFISVLKLFAQKITLKKIQKYYTNKNLKKIKKEFLFFDLLLPLGGEKNKAFNFVI